MKLLPMRAYDYECCAGGLPSRTVRGFTLHDDRPLMVCGVYADEDRHVLFAHFAGYYRESLPSFRSRRALLLAARRARDLVREIRGPVDAVASTKYHGSAGLLERIGFRQISGTTYRFAGETLREKVLRAEAFMLEHGDQVEIPVFNHFADGVYAREIHIPAGTLLTGKIHKHANLNILSAGEISVLTESGVQRVRAPFRVVSPAGAKRIAYAHTDCVWTTMHATQERDPELIEAEFIAQSEEEWQAYCRALEQREVAWLG